MEAALPLAGSLLTGHPSSVLSHTEGYSYLVCRIQSRVWRAVGSKPFPAWNKDNSVV